MRSHYPLDENTIEHDREEGRLAHCRAHGCVATHDCDRDDACTCDVEEFENVEELEEEED
ncbi:MAG TPA: hypothetical protein VD837_05230 [Terriglobales bacterium]|nr:hypothetical protein [Terriglobales bacterium]